MQPPQAARLAINHVLVYWDPDAEIPLADPDELEVDISTHIPQVIVWHAHSSVERIDKIEFNHKDSNPTGEFSDPVGGGGGQAWVSVDKATKNGVFHYAITATPASGGDPKTNDPMVLNQGGGG